MRLQLIIIVLVTTMTSIQANLCTKDLSVVLINRTFNGDIYNENEIIIDEDGVERGCVCTKRPCARKCCPLGKGIDKRCVNMSTPFNPPVLKDNKLYKDFKALENFHLITGFKNCSPDYAILAYPTLKVYNLTVNGSLYVEMSDIPMWFDPSSYCIDNFRTTIDGKPQIILNVVMCYSQEEPSFKYNLQSSLMLISCFFILLTVGAYTCLPNQLRKAHVKVLISYLICFFVAFLCLTTINFMESPTREFCITFTFIIYFSILAAFFWMNVMCYDIWYTFRDIGVSHYNTVSSQKLFYKYCAYAFGMPTALTALFAIFHYVKLPFYVPVLPELNIQLCFPQGKVKFYYLYIPISILCIINIIFFVLTAIKITQSLREIDEHIDNSSHRKKKQRYTMYIHLFILMGLNWILEIVSYLYPEAIIVWYFTDAYNALVGLFIFFIVICKKNIYEELKNSFNSTKIVSIFKTQSTSAITPSSQSMSGKDDVQLNSFKKTQESQALEQRR